MIDQTDMIELIKEKNHKHLQQSDGVVGIASAVQTNVQGNIFGGVEDIVYRQKAFGFNTYKKPLTKSSIITKVLHVWL